MGELSHVSIIIPFKNAEAFLFACCASVENQTYPNWEALLIDDGATDSSVRIARRYTEQDPRFRLIASGRSDGLVKGPWWPRNVGLLEARFGLIAFLDADDLWHPRKLEKQIQAMRRHGAGLCTTSYFRFHATSGLIMERRVPPPMLQWSHLRLVNTIPLSSVLVRRCLLGDGFRPVVHEDHDLWIRLGEAVRPSFLNVTEPLMAYRIHQANLTGGLFRKLAMKRRQRRDWRMGGSGLMRIGLAQARYLLNGLFWRLRRCPITSMGFILDPEIR
jgi:teichuronic acid biosynthesis glycosyltransferase TuaG